MIFLKKFFGFIAILSLCIALLTFVLNTKENYSFYDNLLYATAKADFVNPIEQAKEIGKSLDKITTDTSIYTSINRVIELLTFPYVFIYDIFKDFYEGFAFCLRVLGVAF